jgi:holin-like protein
MVSFPVGCSRVSARLPAFIPPIGSLNRDAGSPMKTPADKPAAKLFGRLAAAGIILFCWVLGSFLERLLSEAHFPVPGNVLGLLLLFGCLVGGVVKLNQVEELADWLIRHLGLFFVPAGVGLLKYREDLANSWLTISVATVASTFAVLAAAGLAPRLGGSSSSDGDN